jgi:hypothetical protein
MEFELRVSAAFLRALAGSRVIVTGPREGERVPNLEGWHLTEARWAAPVKGGSGAVLELLLDRGTHSLSVTILPSGTRSWADDTEVVPPGTAPEDGIAQLLLIHLSEYLTDEDSASEVVLP